jgi:hypothetical protein
MQQGTSGLVLERASSTSGQYFVRASRTFTHGALVLQDGGGRPNVNGELPAAAPIKVATEKELRNEVAAVAVALAQVGGRLWP